jgi:hypothetical protein
MLPAVPAAARLVSVLARQRLDSPASQRLDRLASRLGALFFASLRQRSQLHGTPGRYRDRPGATPAFRARHSRFRNLQ